MPQFNPIKSGGAVIGAAFLMATSAIGPGFLTQTSFFTQQLAASFGFVILISTLIDIAVQLNMWRILTVSNKRAQDVANILLPGLGYVLAALIVLGGMVFNIGNMAGCGVGLQALTGISPSIAAVISAVIALCIFWMKDAVQVLDIFSKILGVLMIVLTLYVAIASHPPIAEAVVKSVWPDTISAISIVTIVGGTVGGYISFAGAHRLLDAGVNGTNQLKQVNKSAVSGIIIAGIMRSILFLAALGVVMQGVVLDKNNPASTVFSFAAGNIGFRFFGIVMWSAAITSIVGASYTSISFVKTFHPAIAKNEKWLISCLVVFSTIIFIAVGKPAKLMVAAGTINGLVLPISLAIILVAGMRTKIMGSFRNPIWLSIAGWIAVAVLGWMSVEMLLDYLNI